MLDIDNYILQAQNKLLPLPRADPSRSTYLTTLAVARSARYVLSDENEDLEETISLSVEAILSFNPHIGHDSHVVTAFFYLADSLFRHSVKLKRLDDSKQCLRYFRFLKGQSLETPDITRDHITTAFALALAIQVRMESVDPTQNIEEMAILCRELLRLDAPDELLLSAAQTLVEAIDDERFSRGRPPPDQAIEWLREAQVRFPDSESVSLRLLFSLLQRFMVTHSHADYEDAMSIVDGSFTYPLPAKTASYIAVGFALSRFYFYGNPEYLEEAIFRIRIYLRTISSEDPRRQEMARILGHLEKARFDEFSVASNLRAADAGNAEVNNRPSPSHLVSSLPITRPDINIGEITPMTQDVEDPHSLRPFFASSIKPQIERGSKKL